MGMRLVIMRPARNEVHSDLHVDFVVFSEHKVPASEGSNEIVNRMSSTEYLPQKVTNGLV